MRAIDIRRPFSRSRPTALQDIREIVEKKLSEMLERNPQRMDYYKKYKEIIADYNREKDRVSIADTFSRLVEFANSLDAEQRRAAEEGLSEDELALFDLFRKDNLSKADRDRLKDASRDLLRALQELLAPLDQWTQKEQTQAEVQVFILDHLFSALPDPPFTDAEKQESANKIYDFVWQQSVAGVFAPLGSLA